MKAIQYLEERFLLMAKEIIALVYSNISFPAFQTKLSKELNSFGTDLCQLVLEAQDAFIKKNPKERKDWSVERNGDAKTVITLFGEMHYQRTYYKNKKTGEYAYLVDKLARIKPHARKDLATQAKLMDLAKDIPYQKAGQSIGVNNKECTLSGQTVMNAIRSAKLSPKDIKEEPKEKKQVK